MSGIGTGYDLSAHIYSPEGRVFQIEYAGKAVEVSGTAIGVRAKDGIVLGVEKLILSKMLEEGSNRRVFSIDRHIGMTFAGLSADARAFANKARSEAKQYKSFYDHPIPGRIFNDRMALFAQTHTIYSHVRPFGISAIFGLVDADGPQIYLVEPSGVSFGYYATAVGKAKQAARAELEKIKWSEITCEQAVHEVARILHALHDSVKDKDFELELSWICKASDNTHQMIPKELAKKANDAAAAAAMED